MRNPNIRCPLPPVGADPDSLRQFEGTGSPKFRVLPLIPSTGGTTNVTQGGGSSTSGGSGGGSGTSSNTLSAKTSTVVLATIPPFSAVRTTINLSQSFQLLSIAANAGCCIRLYGSLAGQAADSARPVDAPPAAEVTQNLIIDIVLDTAPFIWQTQNIIGANQNAPQSTTIYVTVINPGGAGLGSTTVTVNYIPLET
jgi:hypothetical protein